MYIYINIYIYRGHFICSAVHASHLLGAKQQPLQQHLPIITRAWYGDTMETLREGGLETAAESSDLGFSSCPFPFSIFRSHLTHMTRTHVIVHLTVGISPTALLIIDRLRYSVEVEVKKG